MVEAAYERWPELSVLRAFRRDELIPHDEADALWVAESLRRGLS